MTRKEVAAPAQPLRVIDGHNDTLLALHLPRRGRRRSFFERSRFGHVDLPRAREAGLGAAFFAIYVPNREPDAQVPDPLALGAGTRWPLPKPLGRTYALNMTLEMAALLFRLEAASEGALRVVRNAADLRAVLAPDAQTMGAILHIEGAEAIDAEFVALDVLVQAGLRSVGFVWSRPTIFGHGVPFAFPASPDQGPGLTDLGRELVRRCNGHRVLIDLSHLNEKGFWDVAALSNAPLVATHSNVHALCPSTRNLTDAQIKAIAQSGGMMGINFFAGFLRADGSAKGETPLTEIVRHIAYVAELVGEEHVGFGSDMDGVEMPSEFVDVTGIPRLLEALRQAGFDAAGIEKIARGNWMRVLEQTWGG
jgi:membrane dipeptidase